MPAASARAAAPVMMIFRILNSSFQSVNRRQSGGARKAVAHYRGMPRDPKPEPYAYATLCAIISATPFYPNFSLIFRIPSRSNPQRRYLVDTANGGSCQCAGYTYRRHCRHINEAIAMETEIGLPQILRQLAEPVPPELLQWHTFGQYGFLPWGRLVRLLTERSHPGHWSLGFEYVMLDLADPYAECGVKCTITITAPNGDTESRHSIGWDKATSYKDGTPGANGPSVHLAERRAFKRAASYYGIFADGEMKGAPPADSSRQPASQGGGQDERRGQPPAQQQGARVCELCGADVRGNYARCWACKTFPHRNVGMCVSCGKECGEAFAQCQDCAKTKAPGLPQYGGGQEQSGATVPGGAPAATAHQAMPDAPNAQDTQYLTKLLKDAASDMEQGKLRAATSLLNQAEDIARSPIAREQVRKGWARLNDLVKASPDSSLDDLMGDVDAFRGRGVAAH